MESLRHLFRRAQLIWRLRQLELLANYIVEVRFPTVTVIWKIFGSKIFSDAQRLPKFIYLKILRHECLEYEYLRRENFAGVVSL